ncbi:MAG: hypothetical protein K0U67_04825 [Actinomycetia bacterium]|nr:hypothetical protein [Actinomycetes bacterium]
MTIPALLKNPRLWVYLVVGLLAAGLIGYNQWYDSDAQRLKRCIDASIEQMMRDTPVLSEFDTAQPVLASMARASCARQLGITPQPQ